MRTELTHFHLFCGLGGGAQGFNRGTARVRDVQASWRCLGGVDVDPAACRDFEREVGTTATCLDLMDRDQYRAYHGAEPPDGWREATTDDIRRAAGGERPDVVFTSPPCKGFSGLVSERSHRSDRYQALNRLTFRGVWLALEAWADDPPEFFLLENVPRIATRGRRLLDEIEALLDHYGYAHAETTHCCGELGGLGQRRQRFLLVARHREKVPPHLYEPPRRPLVGVGEVLGGFPLPGAPEAGPMHAVRRLQWKTWVRLALIPAGGDWRDLQALDVEDGHLRDFGVAPDCGWNRGVFGVQPWMSPSCTVTGRGGPTNGRFAVADPRPAWESDYAQLGVLPWADPAGAITTVRGGPGSGRFSVADPRLEERRTPYNNVYRVLDWREPAGCVTAGAGPSSGGQAVADPRPSTAWGGRGKYRVTDWREPAGSVIGASTTGSGASSVADPRLTCEPRRGAYGIVPWEAPAGTVLAAACHDNGRHSVADPRPLKQEGSGCQVAHTQAPELPAPEDRLECVIRALDGTWHRPFTTLELAALQGLVEPGEALQLDGKADSRWRERIGNAVPPPAAAAIAGEMGRAILLARLGDTFALGNTPIWVHPLVVALSVDVPEDLPR